MNINNLKANHKQRGSVAAEYVIAAVGIGLAVIVGATTVGNELTDRYQKSTNNLRNFVEQHQSTPMP